MASHDEADKVMNELNLHHQWPGMDAPMTLRWVDRDLLKRRKDDQHPNGEQQSIRITGVPS